MLSERTFYFATAGIEMHVIPADDAHRQLPASEIVGRVFIHRIATAKFGRSGLPGRALSFYRAADRSMQELVEPGDALIIVILDQAGWHAAKELKSRTTSR